MTHKQFIDSVAPMHDDMHRLAVAVTGSVDDAADIVQETMMKLWKARETIPPNPDETAAYCFKAIRLNCLTHLSRRKPSDDIPDKDIRATDSTDAHLLYSDSQRILRQIIESLPDNQRIVIRLTTEEGCDISRTALLTGFSEANVRQLISRARRQIRSKFTLLNK